MKTTCNCHLSPVYEFGDWRSFQDIVAEGEHGFGSVPQEEGVYCLRVAHEGEGETDVPKIIAKFLESPLTQAFKMMAEAGEKQAKASEMLFQQCGFGKGFGWYHTDYINALEGDLNGLHTLPINANGKVSCPILYIGRSRSLIGRIANLMEWKHPLSVALWALLYSKWRIELAARPAPDNRKEEETVKQAYKRDHGGKLPFIMKK